MYKNFPNFSKVKYFEFPANRLWPNGKNFMHVLKNKFVSFEIGFFIIIYKFSKFLPFGHNQLAGNSKYFTFGQLAKNLI